MTTFDEVRQAFPELGLAVYAYEPAGTVTLEIHAPDGEVYTFTGRTLSAALAKAFPAPEPMPAPLLPDVFD